MLRLEGVSLRHSIGGETDSRLLLAGADLAVASGEVQVILGESGAGKSSVLQILAGLVAPSVGDVEALGRSLSKLSSGSLRRLRRRIAIIEETPTFLEGETAFANVEIALEIRGLPRAEIRARAASALAAVGLAQRLDVAAGRLSRSERLWLATARALSTRPAAILADEPWRDLDETGRDRFCALIDELAADGAACIVTTSDHQLVELAELWSWSVSELRDGLISPFHEVCSAEHAVCGDDTVAAAGEPIEVTGLAEVLPFPSRAEASGAH